MEIEICTIGGYGEVGRNMTAVRVGDEVVIFDIGFYLPKVISFEGEEALSIKELTEEQLIDNGIAPDDRAIKDWHGKVKLICVSHAHLDHIGAVPYLASKYKCPIMGTPFTIEVLKSLYYDEGKKLTNEIKVLNPNSKYKISDSLSVEFVNITHSTPQSAMVVLHTPRGAIVYANDYKFDNHPVIGKKPNYARLKEIGKKGVLALVVESLYSESDMKTPSEKVAQQMLKDVILGTDNKGAAIIVTTFASHIARLKSISDLGRKLNRRVVFLGRSLFKYVTAAEKIKIVKFTKRIEGPFSGKDVRKKLNFINKDKSKYLIVCTGNQGEPTSALARMANGDLPFTFSPNDQVIFSCRTIPDPINTANRAILEQKLKNLKVRIFKDIHVSGHAAREDHRDLINMLKPEHIIPSHGNITKLTPLADLAVEMGYTLGETVHLMRNGQKMKLE